MVDRCFGPALDGRRFPTPRRLPRNTACDSRAQRSCPSLRDRPIPPLAIRRWCSLRCSKCGVLYEASSVANEHLDLARQDHWLKQGRKRTRTTKGGRTDHRKVAHRSPSPPRRDISLVLHHTYMPSPEAHARSYLSTSTRHTCWTGALSEPPRPDLPFPTHTRLDQRVLAVASEI